MSEKGAAKLEKFCPNCGAPVSPDKGNCSYCGALLPGITATLAKEKEAKEVREFKRGALNDFLDHLNERKKISKEYKLELDARKREEREREAEEKRKKEQRDTRTSIIGLMFLVALLILFIVYMESRY